MENGMPSPKRIKLSLEPTVEHKTVDITDTGKEIYKDEQSVQDKLMQKVDRIWFERGDWRNITEDSLEASIAACKDCDATNDEKNQAASSTQAAANAPGLDISKLRTSVVNKLFHAKSEVDVALDVINLILAQNRPLSKDVVLPLAPGSLHASYVTKPKPTIKAQLEAAQLTLGLKRKQQKAASEYLKTSAGKLRRIVHRENAFWKDALQLRRNHWPMQVISVPATNQLGAPTTVPSFRVHYGFAEVGSDFGEASFGEMHRADDEEQEGGIDLSLPHNQRRRVAVQVRKYEMNELNFASDPFDKGQQTETQSADSEPPLGLVDTHSTVEKKLIEARSNVLNAELYASILTEAQTLATSNDILFTDNQVIVTIDTEIDLVIQSRQETVSSTDEAALPQTTITNTRQLTGQMFELILRLLLLQRHRFNVWKTHARVLCTNRNLQQLLSVLGEGATTGQQGSSGRSATQTGALVRNKRTTHVAPHAAPHSNHHGQRDIQAVVPILPSALSLCKFWVLTDRVRHLVHEAIDPLVGEGGVPLSVHFEIKGIDYSATKPTAYNSYPDCGELTARLSLCIMKGQFLLFSIDQLGHISVRLPQGMVVLPNTSEFQALLTREVNLICLRMVCDVANDTIRQSSAFTSASERERARLLWKVDDIEESINGSVAWALNTWRSVFVKLRKTRLDNRPAYRLQFELKPPSDHAHLPTITRDILLCKVLFNNAGGRGALTFSEKVKLVVDELVREATDTLRR